MFNDGPKMAIIESPKKKALISEHYNYVFDKETGFFARWGKTKEEDPDFSPFGPEILDLEIDSGECLGNCKFCYKCNGSGVPSKHMSLEDFKTLLEKMPKTLTQIALGITNIHSNPDFFDIMRHSKEKGVIPNYTTHGLDVDEEAVKITSELCGAVAVSIVNKNKTYDAIKKYVDAGMDQVNIHYMLSEETYERAFEIVEDMKTDERLAGMRAIVFLQYKPKGDTPDAFHSIRDPEQYKKLVNFCLEKQVNFGFDSCSAPLFLKSIEGLEREDDFVQSAEPCEGFGMFSSYINCDGEFFPCSFCEGEKGWEEGLDALNCESFLKDVWHSEKIKMWRDIILQSSENCDCKFSDGCRSCPIFDITSCKNWADKDEKELRYWDTAV
jgi:hypothetical protein